MYETPVNLLDKGIYVCYECGYMQPVELAICKQCHEDRFIVRSSAQPLTMLTYKQLIVAGDMPSFTNGRSIRKFEIRTDFTPKHCAWVKKALKTGIKAKELKQLTGLSNHTVYRIIQHASK